MRYAVAHHNLGVCVLKTPRFRPSPETHAIIRLGCGSRFDNDGWPDILLQRHVYRSRTIHHRGRLSAAQALYRNLRNGHFEDVSLNVGPGISRPTASEAAPSAISRQRWRLDFVVNCVNAPPQLIRCDSSNKTIGSGPHLGTKSNQAASVPHHCVTTR